MKEYTWEEIKEHSTPNSLWIVLDGKVYDVTEFQLRHPGKAGPLRYYGGKDATGGFQGVPKHAINSDVEQFKEWLCIGVVRE